MCTLELESLTILSHLTWVPGTKLLHLYWQHPEFSEKVGKESDFYLEKPLRTCHTLATPSDLAFPRKHSKAAFLWWLLQKKISLLDLSQPLTPPQAMEGSWMGSGAPVRDEPPATACSIRGHHLFLQRATIFSHGSLTPCPLAQLCTVAKSSSRGQCEGGDWAPSCLPSDHLHSVPLPCLGQGSYNSVSFFHTI